jgi:alkyl sulfatase BDS1-like metallo-beta-lactamase superfamily hydrolase
MKRLPSTLIAALWAAIAVATTIGSTATADESANPKDATAATRAANAAVAESLPLDSTREFEDARRGLIAELPDGVIRDDGGGIIWDLNQYAFLTGEAPQTVNPSLWRQARLNMNAGLYKVTDRIFQVRGFDLANISFIEGDTGWIVIDPLTAAESARAALDLLFEHRGKKPVVAVIYTHSHGDHFLGVRGVISPEDVTSDRVKVIAPEGFLEQAVSENVIAGNAMSRRVMYQFGQYLERGPKGQVDAGLGKGLAPGSVSLIAPTEVISETGAELTIDGVRIVFQNTPDSEAPAEMNFYFPQFKALCTAETATSTLHNLYAIRGAQVRDALKWSKYLNEAIDLFGGEAEVQFASHHWPHWGNENIVRHLENQRDLYRYLHDQTMHLANQGHTTLEIAEMIELSERLATQFENRGYYGTVNHNVKAVYNKYLGYYDGNPANLHPLPPVEAARKYVEYMGGADAVIERAREAFASGEYRWVAQVLNHVVFADPDNMEARYLEADALEQMGYQAESAVWRNAYLVGAYELRHGVPRQGGPRLASPDVAAGMTVGMLFDAMAVRVNGPRAADVKVTLNWSFTDIGERYAMSLGNGVLNYSPGRHAPDADASIELTKTAYLKLVLGAATAPDLIAAGAVKIDGDPFALAKLIGAIDEYEFFWNIVTP